MYKSRVILTLILTALAVLLLDGIGIIEINLSGIPPQMFDVIGATISAIFLAIIIGVDLMFVMLIARTPNRWWQP